MAIFIKTPESFSDIILNLIIVDVPGVGGESGDGVTHVLVPRHQPDKLIETDLPVTVLVDLTDHLLQESSKL